MRHRLPVTLFVCLGLLALPAGPAGAGPGKGRGPDRRDSHPFPPVVQAKLERAIATAQHGSALPGLAIGVHQPGAGDLELTAGFADVASRTPVTPATHFRIASVTKTFTGTVVLQLVQEHQLALSETIERWFPQLPYAAHITIQDLLAMESGIFDEGGPGSSLVKAATLHRSQAWTPDEIVDFAVQDGSQPPGTPGYSDTNFVMLAAIASAVSHTPYPELLARKILRPLQLRDTSFPTTSLAMPAPAATPYVVGIPDGDASAAEHAVATTFNPSMVGGAGAMISTVGDLERWARALGTGELLSPKLQRLRLQFLGPELATFSGLEPVATGTAYPVSYRLGIAATDGFVGHNGILNGFTSELWFDPSTGASVVALCNCEVFGTDPNYDNLVFAPVLDELFITIAEVLQAQA
jgi:D-alanyl-D-alanine carboxypeptidase